MENGMEFGSQNIRSLYRSDSLKTISGESVKHKLNLLGVKKSGVKGGIFCGNRNGDHLGTGIFEMKKIM